MRPLTPKVRRKHYIGSGDNQTGILKLVPAENWIENCSYLTNTEPKPTNIWVGQTITALASNTPSPRQCCLVCPYYCRVSAIARCCAAPCWTVCLCRFSCFIRYRRIVVESRQLDFNVVDVSCVLFMFYEKVMFLPQFVCFFVGLSAKGKLASFLWQKNLPNDVRLLMNTAAQGWEITELCRTTGWIFVKFVSGNQP